MEKILARREALEAEQVFREKNLRSPSFEFIHIFSFLFEKKRLQDEMAAIQQQQELQQDRNNTLRRKKQAEQRRQLAIENQKSNQNNRIKMVRT